MIISTNTTKTMTVCSKRRRFWCFFSMYSGNIFI